MLWVIYKMCILFKKHVNNPAPDLSRFNHSFVHHYFITECSFAVAVATLLKGQCHEICCFWFFSWISFPPSPEYLIRTVSNFFQKFAEIVASQGAPPVSTTLQGKFAAGVNDTAINDTGGKVATSVKFEMVIMVYSVAWGKLIHKKKLKVENLLTLSL
jgi:hypothetical protein